MYTRKVKVSTSEPPAAGVLVTPPVAGSLSTPTQINPVATPAKRQRRQRKPKMLTMVEAFINQIRQTEPKYVLNHEYKDGSAWREPAWLIYTHGAGSYVFMANSGNLLYMANPLPEAQFMRLGPSQWVELTSDTLSKSKVA